MYNTNVERKRRMRHQRQYEWHNKGKYRNKNKICECNPHLSQKWISNVNVNAVTFAFSHAAHISIALYHN